MKPICCVLPYDFEKFVAQIGSYGGVKVEKSVSLILTDPVQTRSSQYLDNSKHEYLSMKRMVKFVKLAQEVRRKDAHAHMFCSSSQYVQESERQK